MHYRDLVDSEYVSYAVLDRNGVWSLSVTNKQIHSQAHTQTLNFLY